MNLDTSFPFESTHSPHYEDWESLDAESLYEALLDGAWDVYLVGGGTN